MNAQLEIQSTQFDIYGSLTDNHFAGYATIYRAPTTFDLNGERLLDSVILGTHIPAEVNFDIMHINFKEALFGINDIELGLNGVAQLDNDDINLDLQFGSNEANLQDIIALIPEAYKDVLDGINISGHIALSGTAKGTYNDSTMPLVSAKLRYIDGTLQYSEFPLPLHNINATILADADLNKNGKIELLVCG